MAERGVLKLWRSTELRCLRAVLMAYGVERRKEAAQYYRTR